MLKVMTVLGTRPEVIKMSRVVAALDHHTRQILVHTGQNYDYELNQVFFDELEVRRPNFFLEAAGESPAKTIAQVIERIDELLAVEKPDALLLYGDTNSCMCVLPAKRRQIPIFHMEAGNRCFDQRVPEETNRKIIDHLADINMVLTEHARRNLLAEGIKPDTVIKTGSHLPEVLEYYKAKIDESDVLRRLGLRSREYFLLSAHREENVDCGHSLETLLDAVNGLAETYDLPIIFSTHPRTRKLIEARRQGVLNEKVRLCKPFGFLDYVQLQKNALCVLSDSGTLTEETSLLQLSAVMLRDAHERPEGMDVGTLIMSGLTRTRVLEAVAVVIAQAGDTECVPAKISDYENVSVSRQVVRIVLSYVDYVNRTVWFR